MTALLKALPKKYHSLHWKVCRYQTVKDVDDYRAKIYRRYCTRNIGLIFPSILTRRYRNQGRRDPGKFARGVKKRNERTWERKKCKYHRRLPIFFLLNSTFSKRFPDRLCDSSARSKTLPRGQRQEHGDGDYARR